MKPKLHTVLSASQARSQLYRLIDEAAHSHEPITITRKRTNPVLLSEDDWKKVMLPFLQISRFMS